MLIQLLVFSLMNLLMVCLAPCGLEEAEPPSQEERLRGWSSDLELLAQVIREKHKNPFTKCPRAKFDEAVAQLHQRLGTLQDHQILVEFLRLTAMLGDGHTTVQPDKEARRFRRLPIMTVWTRDGLFIAASTAEHQDLLRGRIVRIGPATLDEALQRVRPLSAGENESARMDYARRSLVEVEILHALGLTDSLDNVHLTLEFPGSGQREVQLAPLAPEGKTRWSHALEGPGKEVPISRRLQRDRYGMTWLADSKNLYCWYDSCANLPNRPVSAWCKEVLAEVDRQPVDRLVLDLRRNGGGNSMLLQPLIRGLANRPALNQKGKLFVLIGPGTYSSAMDNAFDFRKQTRALLIGQPTGGSPNEFGEIKYAPLPHCHWQVQYSTKYFKTGAEGETTLKPDTEVIATAAEYFAGRDPVLEAAIRYDARKTMR